MDYLDRYPEFASLKGRTITAIEADQDEVKFATSDGRAYKLYHQQECCESVYIESIVGDLQDLVGEPLLVAEAVTNPFEAPDRPADMDYQPESSTWTFFKLDTRKGGVTIRFFGSSSGYYSESATLERTR